MFNISDYFKKFKKIEGEGLVEKDVILSTLSEFCGTGTVQFKVQKDILYITGSPVMKSAIFTKKARILESIKKKLPASRIVDIR